MRKRSSFLSHAMSLTLGLAIISNSKASFAEGQDSDQISEKEALKRMIGEELKTDAQLQWFHDQGCRTLCLANVRTLRKLGAKMEDLKQQLPELIKATQPYEQTLEESSPKPVQPTNQ